MESPNLEAALPDHRRLGRELDLFSIHDEVGAGLVLWHPRGALVRKVMEDWWRAAHLARGYSFVVSPHVGRASLWEQSGHLHFYRESMFPGMQADHGEYFAKPMNCPFHMKIFQAQPRRRKDLPLRFAELGAVYRYESSGALHGLFRVRGFCQDDAHLFCAPEQAEQEVAEALAFALHLVRAFGFEQVRVRRAGRPAAFVGAVSEWDAAEGALARAAERLGVALEDEPGGGAFYGPKLDVQIRDALGRWWQCSSIQFDFNLPSRFGLSFQEGVERRPPVVIHRALFGSLERFFGILVEHCRGAFPGWLAPEQVRLISVGARAVPLALQVMRLLEAEGIRVSLDDEDDNLGARVRRADRLLIPFIGVIGDREAASASVSLRARGGRQLGARSIEGLLAELRASLRAPAHQR